MTNILDREWRILLSYFLSSHLTTENCHVFSPGRMFCKISEFSQNRLKKLLSESHSSEYHQHPFRTKRRSYSQVLLIAPAGDLKQGESYWPTLNVFPAICLRCSQMLGKKWQPNTKLGDQRTNRILHHGRFHILRDVRAAFWGLSYDLCSFLFGISKTKWRT